MDAQFWINAWNDGRTGFHKSEFHPKLIEYFHELNASSGQSILVPLCGKTLDMIWLQSKDLHVSGVELYEEPVKSFFKENNLNDVSVTKMKDFVLYSSGRVNIYTGDFFKFHPGTFDLIYDRASIVALPLEMREEYAKHITSLLKASGKYLLITYAYDQSEMQGPPFSVSNEEVNRLFNDHFEIKLLESKSPYQDGPRLSALPSLRQNVYILTKVKN